MCQRQQLFSYPFLFLLLYEITSGQIECKRGARVISSLMRDGSRVWVSVSRDSPHLVVLDREIFGASEQGDAQPSGVGVCGSGFSAGICWVIAGT